jgi:hypothetical protein
MDTDSNLVNTFRITREEMLWLMDLSGATSLFGLDLKGSEGKPESTRAKVDPKKITDSLQKKGILHSEGRQGFAVDPQILPILDTLFFPDRTMIVVRDQKGIGRQFFHVLRKGKTIVMHSVPKEREHFIGLIPQPIDVLQLVVGWFPMYPLPVSPARFRIEKESFEQIRRLADAGKTDEALDALPLENLDSAERKNLIRAIADRKVSGSIACLDIHSNRVEGGDSIAVLTDGRTGWLISQDDSPAPEEGMATVRRTGADFSMTVREMVERLTGTKLSRRQADPSGKTIRFALSLDEMAMALAAINCKDLSQKMYAGISRDLTGERYPERMIQAQQSLVDCGLCAISERSLPILSKDLAQAVFPVAKSDSMIQISASGGGPAVETGVHVVRGKSFTAYYNYGEPLQLLEFGKHKDLVSYMEAMFPDFGTETGIQMTSFPVTYEVLEKAIGKAGDRKEAAKILASEGLEDSAARSLAEDLSDSSFRATLIRRDAPDRNNETKDAKNKTQTTALLMLKSPRRSLMFQFQEIGSKGKGGTTNREGFLKALSDLLA